VLPDGPFLTDCGEFGIGFAFTFDSVGWIL
jgi:hypothetical protein